MNERVERMFGPRGSWGKGDERERVEAGKAQRGTGNGPLRPAGTSPVGRGKGDSRGGKKRENRPVQKALKERKAAMPGISGFVSIHCGGCERIINTCLHEKRTVFSCKICGTPTKLENMKSIHVLCPRCGFKGNYRTNRAADEIQMECLNCSQPINFRRNTRGDFLPEVEE